jgi:hypothetical protein
MRPQLVGGPCHPRGPHLRRDHAQGRRLASCRGRRGSPARAARTSGPHTSPASGAPAAETPNQKPEPDG